MSKVAVVTGGTRGIGAAISKGLKEAGYTVAATFAGNREKAEAFKAETGIHVYQWDVADEAACAAGLAQVAADLGPVEVLVNNAGITRDGMFHKMSFEQWRQVLATNLDSMFTMTKPVIEGMRAALRPHHQHLVHQRPEGPDGPDQLLRRQGRRDRLHQALAQENAFKGVTVNCICRATSTPTWWLPFPRTC